MTIKLDEGKEKIYGLDRLDLNKPVNIVEGPIDSLFLDNCIAMAGADVSLKIPSDQCTMIFDNEPRNEHIVNRMIDAVHKNYKVVIFPESLKYKDINDMVIHKNETVAMFRNLYIITRKTDSLPYKQSTTGKGYNPMDNYLPTSYQQYIHKSRYARFLDEDKKRESWSETVADILTLWKIILKTNIIIKSQIEKS